MSLSSPFIRRPVATSLIAIAFLVVGLIAYFNLPVAALPQVDFPTIQVQANLPGASPETMASNVATPLERQLSLIPGVTQMTSNSAIGQTQVVLQFDLGRNIDAAAQDVQSAVNAAAGQLPTNLPNPPNIKKVNPADSSIIQLGLTSDTLPLSKVSDYADSIMGQQISRIEGVGQVQIGGQQRPAVRIQVDPRKVAAMGLQIDGIRQAVANATVNAPKGVINGDQKSYTVYANDQVLDAGTWNNLIVAYKNGAPVRVRDIGQAVQDVENNQIGAWAFRGAGYPDTSLPNGRAILVFVQKQPGANVIETVGRVQAALPAIEANMPPSIKVSVLSDRTQTIRASVRDVEITLLITVGLVVMVIFLFLRNVGATVIASLVIPLALLATAAAMLLLHFSLDNLSLMALTIAVGFVVDDAIVMVEAIWRRIEHGQAPLQAALDGAAEIGFTILTISLSLVAVFTPLMFMGGIVGRLMQEFAFTLSAAVALSVVLALTFTPMMCGKFLKPPKPPRTPVMKALETGFRRLDEGYSRALDWVLRHEPATLAVFIVTALATIVFYVTSHTGFFPQQDTGFLSGTLVTSQDASFAKTSEKIGQVAKVVSSDPDVNESHFFIGGGGLNQANFNVSLKPKDEGRKSTADEVIARLRPRFAKLVGVQAFLQANQDINVGGRAGRAQYQYTLSDADLDELNAWTPRLVDALKQLPEIKDVSSDQQSAAAAVRLTIDRDAAGRFGISPLDIDQAIYNQIGQRQAAQIYTQLNAYHVVVEAPPSLQLTPSLFNSVYLISPLTQKPVPLSLLVKMDANATSSLTISHQGQFPATTLTFNLAPGISLGQATDAVQKARETLGAPATLTGSFQGTAQAFQQSLSSEPVLIAAALLAVYVILGILYESYIHPLTILSTLPSAGLGALLALKIAGQDLNVIGIIAIILLIGIVKKNGILIVDVALRYEREHDLSAEEAVGHACRQRLRPILMTTAAAMLGGIPMILMNGTGSEFRHPLGWAIVGGLVVSQVLTLFTTPVVYIYLDRLRSRLERGGEGTVAAEGAA